MARYKVELIVEATNIKSVEKRLRENFGNAAAKSATKVEWNLSRADRLGEAQGSVEQAKNDVEELRDELQSWYDNLPENFQNGSKGEELESAVSELEAIIDSLDSIDFSSVSFPSMM